jgi:hypothetical protein
LHLQKQAKKAQENGRVPSHFINRLHPAEAKALVFMQKRRNSQRNSASEPGSSSKRA